MLTYPEIDKVFKQVYDSPASLHGKYKWPTKEEDVFNMILKSF